MYKSLFVLEVALMISSLSCNSARESSADSLNRNHYMDNGLVGRRFEASSLVNLAKWIPQAKTADLIESFNSGVSQGDYIFARDGNKLIIDELRRRRKDAKDILRDNVDRREEIFTGSGGELLTIGQVCSDLLNEE